MSSTLSVLFNYVPSGNGCIFLPWVCYRDDAMTDAETVAECRKIVQMLKLGSVPAPSKKQAIEIIEMLINASEKLAIYETEMKKIGALIPCADGGTFENDPPDAISDAIGRYIYGESFHGHTLL